MIKKLFIIFEYFLFFIFFMVWSGYMSPEYAMEGHFSDKSDVYSFGILLLEIVSGRKINSEVSNSEDYPSNLVGYVRINN